MKLKLSSKTGNDPSVIQKIIFLIVIFILFTIIFIYFLPVMVDWHHFFYPAAKNPLHPFLYTGFMNPPWAALILNPISYFSEKISQAINASLGLILIGLLVISRGGGKLSLLLTLTSFPLLKMIGYGNIEWIPAIGFLLQNQWGVPLLLVKPQTGILAILAWAPNLRKTAWLLLPTTVIVLISFIIWGNWPIELLDNIQFIKKSPVGGFGWNIAPFPWAIPVGLGLIYYIIKVRPSNQELLGVLATLCLVPYMSDYSLAIPFALLSASKLKLAIPVWFLLWLFAFMQNWDYIQQILHIL